jgi:asparagine synthase (glutamine-hydrolysing)
MGFGVPIASWIRGELRDWASDLLSRDRLRRDAFLDAGLVEEALAEHLSERSDRSFRLWNVLMFQAWLAQHRGPDVAAAPVLSCA